VRIIGGSGHKAVGRPGFYPLRRAMGSAKLNVRRLIKRDPAKGTSLPFADKITTISGVTGLSGPTSASRSAKARTAAPGAGVTRIRDRGTNRKLKKN